MESNFDRESTSLLGSIIWNDTGRQERETIITEKLRYIKKDHIYLVVLHFLVLPIYWGTKHVLRSYLIIVEIIKITKITFVLIFHWRL